MQTAGLVLGGAVEPPVAQFVLCFLAVLGGAYSTGRYGTSSPRALGIVAASMAPGALLAVEHGSPPNGLRFLQLLFAWAIGFSLRRQLDRIAAALPTGPVPPEPRPDSAAAVAASLTRREMEVLRLVARGPSNRELAELLYIGEGTVKTHVARVREHETGLVASGSHGVDGPGGGGIRLQADGNPSPGRRDGTRAASSFQDVMETRHDPSAVWRRGRLTFAAAVQPGGGHAQGLHREPLADEEERPCHNPFSGSRWWGRTEPGCESSIPGCSAGR